jgi:hypothetical protein
MQHQMLFETKNICFACFAFIFYLANAPGKGTFVAITPIAEQKIENVPRRLFIPALQ